MLKREDLTRDDAGRVIYNDRNIAKMSIWQIIVWNKDTTIANLKLPFSGLWESIKELLNGLFGIALSLIMIITYPISLPLAIVLRAYSAKNIAIRHCQQWWKKDCPHLNVWSANYFEQE